MPERIEDKITYLGERVQHIPVPVMLVDDGYKGSSALSSKSFSDDARDAFITRCSVRASNEQVIFARRNLMHQRICESEAKELEKRKDPHVLHMKDE